MATAKKKTALVTSDEAKEAAALAELSDFFDNQIEVSGMEEVGGEDIKLAVKLFNMGGLDANGNQRQKNMFFDNISEETQYEIDCVFLLTQKSHRWDEFNNGTQKTDVHCQSPDRVTGRMADGSERPCEGCSDTGWFTSKEGKPMKRCGEVHNVVAVERLTQKPFLIRFKKTNLKPWRAHLMQHHYGTRQKADGGRGHIPLFAFEANVSLVMHESGNYALPVFKRGAVLARDEMVAMHESAKGYLDMMSDVLSHADKVDSKHAEDSDGLGGSSSDDFADDGE